MRTTRLTAAIAGGAALAALLAVQAGSAPLTGGTASHHNPFELYRTIDGGRTFTPIGGLPLPSSWLVFTSRDDGIAIGYPPQGSRVLLRTVDGGRHWQAVSP